MVSFDHRGTGATVSSPASISHERLNAVNTAQGGGTMAAVIDAASVRGIKPDLGDMSMTLPAVFVVMTFMMWN